MTTTRRCHTLRHHRHTSTHRIRTSKGGCPNTIITYSVSRIKGAFPSTISTYYILRGQRPRYPNFTNTREKVKASRHSKARAKAKERGNLAIRANPRMSHGREKVRVRANQHSRARESPYYRNNPLPVSHSAQQTTPALLTTQVR
jgi:hypothetical protein